MPGFDLGLFARNTARALLFVFPLLLASIWVTAQWFGDGGDGWAAGALYYFLTLGAPIVLGAVLHQLVLTVVGRAEFARDRLRHRTRTGRDLSSRLLARRL